MFCQISNTRIYTKSVEYNTRMTREVIYIRVYVHPLIGTLENTIFELRPCSTPQTSSLSSSHHQSWVFCTHYPYCTCEGAEGAHIMPITNCVQVGRSGRLASSYDMDAQCLSSSQQILGTS